MTRGTAYAALEIVLWLLAAAIVGFMIGWLLRRWRTDRRVEDQLHSLHAEEERKRGKLQLELADCEAKAATLKADLEHRTATLDRTNIQLGEREKTIAGLRDNLSATRSTEMRLEAKVEDRESTIASLRASIGKEDRQLTTLRKDLDAANGTVGALRNDAEGYRATIEALRLDLDVERRKQDDLSGKLEATAAEATAAAASLAASRSSQESLHARIAELETQSENSSEVGELLAELAGVRQERDRFVEELSVLQAEHADCGDRPEPEVAPIAAATTSAPEEEVTEAPLPEKDLAVAKVAEIAARTRGDGPAVDDDLKKIHGVGPKLEKLLKSMDITSFRQVANFTLDDIQYVTAALDAFPGRIERDDWMSSAADQHTAKYDEPA